MCHDGQVVLVAGTSTATGDAPRIRLLGEVQVVPEAGQDPAPVRGLPALLLCVLSLHLNQVLSPDRLADALWGEDQPQNPSNALHRLVVRLRRLLPADLAAHLVTQRPGYILRVPRAELDIECFPDLVDDGRRLVDEGAPALAKVKLATARALLRGEPFGGRTDPALRVDAARIHELALVAEEAAADAALALGDHHGALTRLEPLHARHPLRERFAEQLMLARYRAGQQSAALEVYRTTRSALVTELGVEPGPGLEALNAAILNHDPSLVPAPAGAPRPGPSSASGDGPGVLPLLGREELLEALHEARRLANGGRQVLVILTGDAGSGRSRLLSEFAAMLPDREVTLTTAHETDHTDPGGLFRRLTEGASRRRVVILDDATAADPTSLTQLACAHAAGDGNLMVWAHRSVVGLPPQPLHRLTQGAAASGEVVRMYVPRLTTAQVAEAFVDDTDMAVVRSLVEASDGVARELERLVARLVAEWTLDVRDQRLAVVRALPPLAQLDTGSMPEICDREVADVLAVAGRPVPVHVLAAALQLNSADVVERVRPMINEGTVREDPRGLMLGGGLDVGRIVARLGEMRKAALLSQLADGWVHVGLERADAGAVGGYYLSAGRPGQARPLLADAGIRAAAREAYHEALPLVEAALGTGPPAHGDDGNQGRLLLARAEGRVFTGPLDAALTDALTAIGLLNGADRQRARVVSAEVAMSLRRHEVIDDLVRAARTDAGGSHDGHLGELLSIHANVHTDRGDHNFADAEIRAALEHVDRTDDVRARAHTYLNAGWIALERGEATTALRRLTTALNTGRLAGTDHEVNARLFLARAQFLTGEVGEAVTNHRRAAFRVETEGMTGMAALARGTLAAGLLVIGRFDDALVAADEMLRLAPHASPIHEIAARTRRAQALAGSGKTDEATGEIEDALALCPAKAERLRLSVTAVAAQVAAASSTPWSSTALDELAARLDAACRPLSVVEILTVSAATGGGSGPAERAVRSALDLGVPMHAARAAEAGSIWSGELGAAVSAGIRAMRTQVPPRWRADWERLPEVSSAMAHCA
nr:BTAD domain-containing putative transcriptional regulator [Phytoactinopolyspora mesophila]